VGGLGGVYAVLNVLGLVCRYVNEAWKFTPQARVIYVDNKRVKTHRMQLLLDSALFKWARAIGISEGS
jgi:uncharacterized phage-associated protein